MVVLNLLKETLFLQFLFFLQYQPDEYLLGSKCMFNPNLPIDEQTESIPYDPRWEFPQNNLHFGKF